MAGCLSYVALATLLMIEEIKSPRSDAQRSLCKSVGVCHEIFNVDNNEFSGKMAR